MHVLPRVAELEERFADVLVGVGVHAGKFAEERRTPNIREACKRLGVGHPVVNDRQYRIWRAYAVQAWPTVALVAPDGRIARVQAGEFDVEDMAETIAAIVEHAEGDGTLRRGPADFGVDPLVPAEPAGVLRYPSRIVAGEGMLYIADTGHCRVLEARLDEHIATVVRVFGSGRPGFEDGPAEAARFLEPQGLALAARTLFVADRRNHAVRAVDLERGDVRTVAGTGELAAGSIAEGPGLASSLRSPWGLASAGDTLYVTMAGSHQLWALDLALADHPLRLVAGSGGEDIRDGRAHNATLAQPSGLATEDGLLFLADAESSAVRSIDAGPGGEVRTIVGTGLFDFGDRDGEGDDVLLQHDLDLAVSEGEILVVDTYNGKVKAVDPDTRRCEALPGPAGIGEDLWEPAGISAGPAGVFVADTNHHRIVRLDPGTGALETIEIRMAP